MLRSGWTDRCLEPDQNGLFTDGDQAQLWDCGGIALEAFSITKNPEGFYRFQNAVNGKYLEESRSGTAANGTQADLWSFVAGGKHQWWTATVNPEGFLRLRNAYSGRYLEASKTAPGGGVNGTKVQLWDFVAGGIDQWWH